ncbi:hypothetical protein TNCV_4376151 [Trichonephila clavipes]|nr:hypothetical protein TNCV_4376151 [Trichonephila clavipes]
MIMGSEENGTFIRGHLCDWGCRRKFRGGENTLLIHVQFDTLPCYNAAVIAAKSDDFTSEFHHLRTLKCPYIYSFPPAIILPMCCK